MEGISKKIYLELEPPTEEDSRSGQARIMDALKERGLDTVMDIRVMRKLYPLCEDADWKVTVSLAWDGYRWVMTDLEAGDTGKRHFGLATDLGSTTVVTRLINCETGDVIAEANHYNRQISLSLIHI